MGQEFKIKMTNNTSGAFIDSNNMDSRVVLPEGKI